MKKIRILKSDFDKAVKQRWNINTCILSQAAIRLGLLPTHNRVSDDKHRPSYGADFISMQDKSGVAYRLMKAFDSEFMVYNDPNTKTMEKLRASLPITVEVPDQYE